MEPPRPVSDSQKLRAEVLAPLAERFPGKETLIELIALALAAAENLLIVGPPGTAKSLVVSEFATRIRGRYFEYLLTRFTEPTEIFGPVDIAELREGRLVTRTEGMLPDAEIVFLDEVFNAGSSILNSLLGIINEGVFRRGSEIRRCDLISVLAATNRIPDDPSLRALDDRFTLRAVSPSVLEDQMGELLRAGWEIERERLARQRPESSAAFTVDSLRTMHAAVADVELEDIRSPLGELVRRIRAGGVFVSDRRAVKLQRLVAASAVLCDRRRALPCDLWPARHLWENEEDVEPLEELVENFLEESGASQTDGELSHPLASGHPSPTALLERLRRVEAEVRRLEGLPPTTSPLAAATDALHNQLHDIAAERRWCRAQSQAEKEELRELGKRLESVSAALAKLDG